MLQVINPEILQAGVLQRFCPASAQIRQRFRWVVHVGEYIRTESGPRRLRQRKSSVLHLSEMGILRSPARVFDSRTPIRSFTKSTSLQSSDNASRRDRIPVSRIRTAKARM